MPTSKKLILSLFHADNLRIFSTGDFVCPPLIIRISCTDHSFSSNSQQFHNIKFNCFYDDGKQYLKSLKFFVVAFVVAAVLFLFLLIIALFSERKPTSPIVTKTWQIIQVMLLFVCDIISEQVSKRQRKPSFEKIPTHGVSCVFLRFSSAHLIIRITNRLTVFIPNPSDSGVCAHESFHEHIILYNNFCQSFSVFYHLHYVEGAS